MISDTGPAMDGSRILIVEDDPSLGPTLEALLGTLHAVQLAVDGSCALRLFDGASRRGTPFDLVLTDYDLPGLNGIELARAIHSQHGGTPIVLYSGRSNILSSERILFARVLLKPAGLDTLERAISEAIDAARQTRELRAERKAPVSSAAPSGGASKRRADPARR